MGQWAKISARSVGSICGGPPKLGGGRMGRDAIDIGHHISKLKRHINVLERGLISSMVEQELISACSELDLLEELEHIK